MCGPGHPLVSCGGASSVIHCDVPEEIRHGFPVVDPPNRFRQNQADVHRLDFRTLQFLDLVRHRVCHHHLEGSSRHNRNELLAPALLGQNGDMPTPCQGPPSKAAVCRGGSLGR